MGLANDFKPVAVVRVPDRKNYLRVREFLEGTETPARANDADQTYKLATDVQVAILESECLQGGLKFKPTTRLYEKPDDTVPERERALAAFNDDMAHTDPVPYGVYVGSEVTIDGIELELNGEESFGVIDEFMKRQGYNPTRNVGFVVV
ncbi:MAG TPA: hypothetical protein VJA47_04130 [archaeon]|nr:hypothetical protein [archaeon]